MSDDFQQTVDLKIKKEEQKLKARAQAVAPGSVKNARGIDKVFQETKGEEVQNLKKIDQYKEPKVNENIFRRVVFFLALIIIGAVVYFMFVRGGDKKQNQAEVDWYAVKLINGEEYYGEISDTKSDPIVLNNVYYNYDQLKDGVINKDYSPETSANLRLVKRGKETHGPSGSMDIVRAQVVYMEPLKEDSKVLKAILNYEK
ncbi:MAG: hypothetical protein Q7T50_04875 [Candidatus Magasanikbacteria bacterium]|nr:hypothetical protein [Candidatus Magasanikbacteria bacterium]